jgi:hypothetical protein
MELQQIKTQQLAAKRWLLGGRTRRNTRREPGSQARQRGVHDPPLGIARAHRLSRREWAGRWREVKRVVEDFNRFALDALPMPDPVMVLTRALEVQDDAACFGISILHGLSMRTRCASGSSGGFSSSCGTIPDRFHADSMKDGRLRWREVAQIAVCKLHKVLRIHCKLRKP